MNTNGDVAVKVVPVRHVGRWIGLGAVSVLLVMLVHTLFFKVSSAKQVCVVSGGVRTCHGAKVWRFQWDIVKQYFFTAEVLHGLLITVELTVISMIIGIVLGMAIAVMRMSPNRVLSSLAWSYTWFFRGTPVLVQLVFWAFIGGLYPHLSLGIPFTHVAFVHINVNLALTPFEAVIIGLGLNEGAYMSEIARSGLISVDEGQTEAASSLGMTRRQTLRLVIIPQAMRVIIPPTGNEVISMLKTTSLASTVGVLELFGAVENVYATNYKIIPLLIVASIWYLLVTTVLSIGQFYLERRFARGALRTPPPTPLQRLRADLRGIGSKFRTQRGVVELRS
ncbi:MAG: amino acid ABC transporter permease [Acidobacteria bacterium]|nr:amino acid ABC transporter permease [Acidobacteriota bacterium]